MRVAPIEREAETETMPLHLQPSPAGGGRDREAMLVAVLDATDARLAAQSPAERSRVQESMLRLLTYCYAAGLYGSEEVEEAVRSDPTLRWLVEDGQPLATSIRGFRRRHRDVLADCLAEVLERLTLARSGAAARPCPDRWYAGRSLQRWQLPADAGEHRAEAQRRIARAIRIDSADLDL